MSRARRQSAESKPRARAHTHARTQKFTRVRAVTVSVLVLLCIDYYHGVHLTLCSIYSRVFLFGRVTVRRLVVDVHTVQNQVVGRRQCVNPTETLLSLPTLHSVTPL
jgi:hypothetical protein